MVLPTNIVENQANHAGLHNATNVEVNRIDVEKTSLLAVYALMAEWTIYYDETAKAWPARNVPALFASTYPDKWVVWVSRTAAAGYPPNALEKDYWRYRD